MSMQWTVAMDYGQKHEVDPTATSYSINGGLLTFSDDEGKPYAVFRDWQYFWAEEVEE